MTEFLTPTDIGNRALQHCGAPLMDAVLGFTEQSLRAQAVSFAYGKLRRAELERNAWGFATKRAILRAVDPNTMLLSPSLWSSGATYFVGSIVSDASNNLWQSRIPNSLGNDPQNTAVWEQYFGPMSVMLYDSSQSYASDELVYTAPGNGTYNVYRSMVNNNALDPSLPNQWSVSTTYFKNDVVQVFAAWSSLTTYAAGQTIKYTDGNVYASLVAGNLNNIPTATLLTKWALVPVEILPSLPAPTTQPPPPAITSPVIEWAQTTTYSIGAFVLFNGTEYVSIANNNTGNFPTAAASTFWAAVTLGTNYMSLIDLNYGNSPANAPALWAAGTTYALGNQVGGSDGVIYQSLANGNIGNNPTTDGGVHWSNTGVLNPWTTNFIQGGGNQQWLQIGGSASPSGVGLSELSIVYPLGAGPSTQEATRNIFRLPSGYLKTCSQDPKAGSTSFLGAESGLAYKDWLVERPYLVSREVGPIMFRFVADLTDVTMMATQFCEGLACRIALEVCEPLTQSAAKLQTIAKEYEKFMGEARTSNAIEVGSEEPPVDDWIECRN
jgi:hypothetical protein